MQIDVCNVGKAFFKNLVYMCLGSYILKAHKIKLCNNNVLGKYVDSGREKEMNTQYLFKDRSQYEFIMVGKIEMSTIFMNIDHLRPELFHMTKRSKHEISAIRLKLLHSIIKRYSMAF